ncbi:hypothetical protein KDI_37940 [Dictyobacter arantiisoli]|uniref:Uncharacterized protein n=1 Tax=Dictyobacter arantiisoli TaxID=2014874 RepID=A0A5A5TF82_9CHLR|nr:hypothetical protein KDI_37940 [Dictyobacter arantiisoli]
MNPLPAILIGGPPHAGKSVLFYSLTHALRERNIPHHVIPGLFGVPILPRKLPKKQLNCFLGVSTKMPHL